MSEIGEVRSVGRADAEGLREEAALLLEANRSWAEARTREDPGAFDRLARGQAPPFLFVGCCDSRKPLDTITGTNPGQLFIHRNIANLLPAEDRASGAVLEFAMGVLQVRHLIVCGHTRCGGVAAALRGVDTGEVGAWIAPVRALANDRQEELARVEDGAAREDRLAALNVIAQVENALGNPAVAARLRGEGPPLLVHGWIFHVETGRLEALALPEGKWRESGLLPPQQG